MSKLLKQDQQLDTLRSGRNKPHAAAASETSAPQPLLLTYQPVASLAPASRLRAVPAPRWISRRTISRLLVGTAAYGVLLAVATQLAPRQAAPVLPAANPIAQRPTLGLPAPAVKPAAVASAPGASAPQPIAERRTKEMDRALRDARQVMALMEQAVRKAARAYPPSPSAAAPSRASGTSS
jgi:hypothetical protein